MEEPYREPWAIVTLDGVDPAAAARLTAAALAERGMNAEDLAAALRYCSTERSLEKVERVLAGAITQDEVHILRRIARILHLDQELLCGERLFWTEDDYQRFLFRPSLMRVAERSRPSQVLMAGIYGLSRIFLVQVFPELLQQSVAVQLAAVRPVLLADQAACADTRFFGKKIGYALFHRYGEALPLSVSGEVLDQLRVECCTACIGISFGRQDRGRGTVTIPRFVPRDQPEPGTGATPESREVSA